MSARITIEDFEQVGVLYGDAAKLSAGIENPLPSIDSRTINDEGGKGFNEMFFALKGENADGHEFVQTAFDNGAALAVVSRKWWSENKNRFSEKLCLVVEDPLVALQKLATIYRRKFAVPMVAITGSNGKTTTKEMTALVLSEKYPTMATVGNLNNLIGVPLTLFGLRSETEIAVVEMGMNHYTEVAEMCRIAEPTHGLITNVGTAHIEFFGSRENIAVAKGELFEYLNKTDGSAFVFADDALVEEKSSVMTNRTRYGIETADVTVRATLLESDALGCPKFRITTGLGGETDIEVQLSISGKHNAANALAAATVGLNFGVPAEKIKAALERYQPKANSKRMEVLLIGGMTILNDCYNANPDSMKAALTTLAELKTSGKKIAVLGDMFELGAASEDAHRDIGKFASGLKIDALFTTGEAMKAAYSISAVKRKEHFAEKEKLAEALSRVAKTGDAILIKGSRGMKMETIVGEFKKQMQD